MTLVSDVASYRPSADHSHIPSPASLKHGTRVTDGERESIARNIASKRLKICVDFDGVIHQYTEWKGHGYDAFDPPVPGARLGLKHLEAQGHEIIIFTTRGEVDDIARWMKFYDIPYHHINSHPGQWEHQNPGKPHADLYIDDRAYRFNGNWDDAARFVENGVNPWYLK